MVEDLADVEVVVDRRVVGVAVTVGVVVDEEDLLVAGMYCNVLFCVRDIKTRNAILIETCWMV